MFVNKLKAMIEKWCEREHIEVICDWFREGECLTHEILENCDILFFDIELNGMLSGIDAAKQARTYNASVPIVFTTSHSNYVFEGYEVEAYKFLIKPVPEAQCFACMERARRYRALKQTDSITIPHGKGLRRIPICDILYIEAQQHYCNVITLQDSHRFFSNLSSLLANLPEGTLLQCHRSYIVNCAHIVSMENGFLTLRSKEKIPYSRTFAKQLLQALSGMR